MADNFVANPGVGGSTFRADDVGAGLLIPFSKIDAGGDGLQVPIIAGQQTMSASLPVVFASDQTALTVGTHAVTQSGGWTVTANAGTGTFTVSGTVAATQSGTWNIGSITTLPALVAGSALIGHVDGAAASGAAKAGNPLQMGGVFNTTQPTVTTGQAVEAQMTARGAQIVATGTDAFAVNATQSGTWNIGTVTTLPALPANQSVNVAQINGVAATMGNGVSGTGVQRVTLASDSTGQVALATGANTIGALTANQSVNVNQLAGVAVSAGNGVSGTGVQRVTLASDSTGQVAIASGTVTTVSTLTNITNWGNIVDNAAFTDGTTRVSMSGFIFDEVAGTALTENDAAAARIDSKRALVCGIEDGTTRGQRVAVDASGNLAVSNKATATGGSTIQKVLSAASTNATSVKASAGNILGIALMNTNAAVRYLHLYNKASAPTVGTDVPVATFAIPGNAAGAGFTLPCDIGAAFATGIAYALTTGAADTDTGAVALNEITGWILYK